MAGRSGFGALLYVSSLTVNAITSVPAVFNPMSGDDPAESVSVTSPTTFTWERIASIKDFNGPDLSTNDIDITDHDTEDGYMAYAPGLKEPGEYNFDIHYDPTLDSHDASDPNSLPYLYDHRETRWWTVTMSDNPNTTGNERATEQFCFKGYVKGFQVVEPLDDAIVASVAIKITGKPYLPLETR